MMADRSKCAANNWWHQCCKTQSDRFISRRKYSRFVWARRCRSAQHRWTGTRKSYRGQVVRARDTDACPGALQVHQAADGALVRVRLPGGMITAAQLTALANASNGFGSGTLELNARGHIQLRAIPDVT